jgi:hypothetical protein
MRRIDHQQADMFSYLSPELRVRKGHPLRAVGVMTDEILEAMSPLFDAIYAERGRSSIAPEQAAAGAVVADALLSAQQAAIDGRDRL